MNLEVMKQFYEQDVNPALSEILSQLDSEYEKNSQKWKQEFLDVADAILKKLPQAAKTMGEPPCYLMFQLLRTEAVHRKFQYQIIIYGEQYFLEEELLLGEWNPSFVYSFYDVLWERLLLAYPKYIMKLSEADVESVMMDVLPCFEAFMVRLMCDARNEMIGLKSYQAAPKGREFMVQCGEYFEVCKPVHREVKEKEERKLLKAIQKKKDPETYKFRDYRNMDFSDYEYIRYDFIGTDFTGSRFERVHMNLVKLKWARMNDCDLTEAVFENCNMEEVDFTGAKVTGTVFRNTFLTGAVFTEEQVTQIGFSEKQLAQIKVIQYNGKEENYD